MGAWTRTCSEPVDRIVRAAHPCSDERGFVQLNRWRRIVVGLAWLATCVPAMGAMLPIGMASIAPASTCCGPTCACTPAADCGCKVSPAPSVPAPAHSPATLPIVSMQPSACSALLPAPAWNLAVTAPAIDVPAFTFCDRSPPGLDRLVPLRI